MLVTADDFVRLKERLQDRISGLNAIHALAVFDELTKRIEPTFVVTDPGGGADWFEEVVKARHALSERMAGVYPAFLDEVARIAAKYARSSGMQPQRALPSILSIPLRRIAEEDWSRALGAAQREDAKTAAIAGGSVVEAICLDVLERLSEVQQDSLRDYLGGLPEDRRRNLRKPSKPRPEDWPFAFLLLSVGPEGLQVLQDRTHEIGHTLRDWRNFVHPSVSRKEEPLTAADGRLATGLAEKTIEDFEAWAARGARLTLPTPPLGT